MNIATRSLPLLLLVCLSAARGEVQNGLVRSAGQPIPGASVTAECEAGKISTVTDDAGRFEMGGLPSTACRFSVAMFGFELLTQEIKASQSPVTFELKLQGRATIPVTQVRPAAPASAAAATPAPAAPTSPAPATPNAAPQRAGRGAGGTQVAGGNAGPGRGGPGRGGANQRGQVQGGGRGGFQNLSLVQNGESATDADPSLLASAAGENGAGGASEAMVVNGSISSGVQAQAGDGFGFGPGGFGDRGPGGLGGGLDGQGGFGPGGAAFGQLPGGLEATTPGGAPAGADGGGRGGPGGGGRGGPGGPGGGFGGPGGGGRGGGGFGGGGGGRGGGQARGPAANGRAQFGNRVNRGRGPQFRLGFNYSLGDSIFNARPYSFSSQANGQSVAKPSYSNNRYGFNLGGPLNIPHVFKSEKTFWFFNYTGQHSSNGIDRVSTVPNAAQRGGDFSALLPNTVILDPLTGQPFPGNIIPGSRISPAAKGLLNLIPVPTGVGARNNYELVDTTPANSNSYQVMINQTITTKDRLAVNLNYQNRNSIAIQNFGFHDPSDGSGSSLSLSYSHTFRPTLINTLAFNFSRNVNNAFSFFSNGTDIAGSLGITGLSSSPLNYGPPTISFTNYGSLSDSLPSETHTQTAGLTDSMIYRHGKQNITYGVNFQRRQNNILTNQGGRGSFNFNGTTTGYDLADFLLSRPYSTAATRYLNGDNAFYFRETAANAYISHDWRATARFSLTSGLRWEYFGPYSEKNNRLSNLQVAPGYTGVTVQTAQGGATLIQPKYRLFSPREGIAWRPLKGRQLVVRAGYGIYYTGGVYSAFTNRLAIQPPFVQTSNLAGLSTLSLENGFTTVPSQTIQNTFAVQPDYSPAYAQTWNFSLQETFARSYVVNVSYIGTKGTHLDVLESPNRADVGDPKTTQQRLRIANASTFSYDVSSGNSIYNAGTISLNRRMARNRSFGLSYTLANSIDDASTLGSGVVQFYDNFRLERAQSSGVQRHRFVFNYNLQSPVGTDRQGRLWDIVRGWTLSGNLIATSGSPFTATLSTDPSGTGIVGSARALVVPGQPVQNGNGYFNPAAFAAPPKGVYMFGNAGRNTIPGVAGFTTQASLFRSFRIGERHQLSFQVNATNPINHVNITNFGTVIDSINAGLPTGASGMRNITFSTRFTY